MADIGHNLLNPGREGGTGFRMERSHRSLKGDLIGNDIGSPSPLNFAKGNHHGSQGILRAANGLLQSTDHLSGNPNRIYRFMGAGTVARFSQNR